MAAAAIVTSAADTDRPADDARTGAIVAPARVLSILDQRPFDCDRRETRNRGRACRRDTGQTDAEAQQSRENNRSHVHFLQLPVERARIRPDPRKTQIRISLPRRRSENRFAAGPVVASSPGILVLRNLVEIAATGSILCSAQGVTRITLLSSVDTYRFRKICWPARSSLVHRRSAQ